MMTKLPEYKGYTVDFRLGEFREVTPGRAGMISADRRNTVRMDPQIEFYSFKSEEGDKLLAELLKGKGGKSLMEKAMDYMRLHS